MEVGEDVEEEGVEEEEEEDVDGVDEDKVEDEEGGEKDNSWCWRWRYSPST